MKKVLPVTGGGKDLHKNKNEGSRHREKEISIRK
jgi:hypothetical protein